MSTVRWRVSSLLFGFCLAGLCAATGGQQTSRDRTLDVKVHYSGSGTVDEKHKIFVVLWDSPEFTHGAGVEPVAIKPAAKNGTVTFSHVQKVPAYVSAVYDSSGTWDAQTQPPSGSPLGLYSTSPGTAAPVDIPAGQTAKVTITFDDSRKMP